MTVQITDDFDLTKIAQSGQCFRWNPVSGGEYRIIHAGNCLYIRQSGETEYCIDCTPEQFHTLWEPYFDLAENYGKIRARIDRQQDSFLYEAAEDQKGIRILRQDPWETLISFIISQNKNIPAIKKSVELLARYAGEKLIDSRGKEYYAFPTPEAIAAMREEDLTACKVGYRWKYIKAAANDILNGNLNLAKLLHTEETETIQKLTEVYGVGIKVASCVSLYGLHHTDAFPIDVWMKRILADKYPNGYPFEGYSPYNGIYQQYLFAYYRKQFT